MNLNQNNGQLYGEVGNGDDLWADAVFNRNALSFNHDSVPQPTAHSRTPSDYSSLPYSAAPFQDYLFNTTDTRQSDVRSHSEVYTPYSSGCSPTEDQNFVQEDDTGISSGQQEHAFQTLGLGVDNNTGGFQIPQNQYFPSYLPNAPVLDPNRLSPIDALNHNPFPTQRIAASHGTNAAAQSYGTQRAQSLMPQTRRREEPCPTLILPCNDDQATQSRSRTSTALNRPIIGWSNPRPGLVSSPGLEMKFKRIIQRFRLSPQKACQRLSEMYIHQNTTSASLDDEVAEITIKGFCVELQDYERSSGLPRDAIVAQLNAWVAQAFPPRRRPIPSSNSSTVELPFCCLFSESPSTTYMPYRLSLVDKPCAHKGTTTGFSYCKKCEAKFDNEIAWRRHIEQTDPKELWCCRQCNESKLYHRKDQVLDHLKGKPHNMSKSQAGDSHSKYMVDDGKAIIRQCKECGETESDWVKFYKHIWKHMKSRIANDQEERSDEQPPDNEPPAGGSFGQGPTGGSEYGGSYSGSSTFGTHGSNTTSYNSFGNYQNYQARGPIISNGFENTLLSRVYKAKPPHVHVIGGAGSEYDPTNGPLRNHGLDRGTSQLPTVAQDGLRRGMLSSLPKINTNVPRVPFRPKTYKPEEFHGTHHPYCSQYHCLGTISKTRNSCIEQVQDETTKSEHVRKTVVASVCSGSSSHNFGREVHILKKLQHPHITQLVSSFIGKSMYSFVMNPVADCSLQQFLESPPNNFRPKLKKWFGCLASAVDYLHSSQVSVRHSDLKPANVLVQGEDIYLADFGISKALSSPMNPQAQPEPLTRMYAAPEIFQQGIRDWRADIYALGCIFLEMITVLCNISIQEYHRTLMEAIAATSSNAMYMERLIATHKWIGGLRKDCSNGDLCNKCKALLNSSLNNVESMLSDNIGARPSAEEVLKKFPHQCPYLKGKIDQTPTSTRLLTTGPVEPVAKPWEQQDITKAEDPEPQPTIKIDVTPSPEPSPLPIKETEQLKPPPAITLTPPPTRPRATTTGSAPPADLKPQTTHKRSLSTNTRRKDFVGAPHPKAAHVIEGALDRSRVPQARRGQVFNGFQDPRDTAAMFQSWFIQTLPTRSVKRKPSQQLHKPSARVLEGKGAQIGVVSLLGLFRS